MTENLSWTHVGGGMEIYTHETMLWGVFVKGLSRCNIVHAVLSTVPSKKRTGNGNGNYTMDLVTSPGSIFSDNRQDGGR